MKAAFYLLLLIVLAAVIVGLSACTAVQTRTITTDKAGTVTEVLTTTRATDPAALALAGSIATAYAPRAVIVRQEKSGTPADLRRILHGRPITRQEIAHRWKPSTP